jgi:post-segregation antitoxin (ccd killing protein)
MGRTKKKAEEKKQSVSIALNPELLEYYRKLHINLSSLINDLLKQYKENGNKGL